MNAATFIQPPDVRTIRVRRARDGEDGRPGWFPALRVRRIWKVSCGHVVFESAATLRPGDVVGLGVDNAEFQRGRVVWVRNDLCSCRIDPSGRLLACLRDEVERCRLDTVLIGELPAAPETDDRVRDEPGGFAAFLRASRKRQRLTRMDLARRLGVSKVTIWKWETGKALPRTRRVLPLAEALAVSEKVLHQQICAAAMGSAG